MLREIQVLFKLGPRLLKLRDFRQRELEGKPVDEKEMEKEARKLLDTFISLGPAFIKLGQILSVHSDILPEPYLKELSKLQDEVPPAPWKEVEKIIKEDLKEKYEEYEIDPEPISSASIGQVYLAKEKKTGRIVVFKVNRPKIREIAERDIKVIKTLLPLIRHLVDESFYESLSVIISDFSKRIFEEMDFTKEASYMKKLKEELEEFPDVRVPELYYYTQRVLIMEYLKGHKVTSEEAKKIVPPSYLAYRVFKVFMLLFLTKEYFHADPHPGNIAVDERGNLILYDFGMIGRMDKETRNRLLRAYAAFLRFDAVGIVKALEELGAVQPEADRELLAKGIELFLKNFEGITAETLEIETFIKAANEVFYRFPLKIPEKLAIYIRMSAVLGGTCTQIDPNFNFFVNLRQIIEEEGLQWSAMFDDIRDTIQSAIKKFRLSLLEKPITIQRKNNRMTIVSSLIVMFAIIYYLLSHDAIISILIGMFALTISRI